MSGRIDGSQGQGRIWEDCEAISKAGMAEQDAAAQDAVTQQHASARKEAKRPARQDPAIGAAPELRRLQRKVLGAEGQADAKAVLGLLKKNDPEGVAHEIATRFKDLLQKAQQSPGERPAVPKRDPRFDVFRFQSFLGALEKEKGIADLHTILDRADSPKHGFAERGALPFYLGHVIFDTGTQAQQEAWGAFG